MPETEISRSTDISMLLRELRQVPKEAGETGESACLWRKRKAECETACFLQQTLENDLSLKNYMHYN